MRSLFHALGWMAAIYVAIVLQAQVDDAVNPAAAPVLTAAIAGWAVVSHGGLGGVVWAAVIGFACDAAGHGRLGLHLATYAAFAALAASWMTDVRPCPRWRTVAAAAQIAGGDEFVCRLLSSPSNGDARAIGHAVAASLQSAGATAGVVFVVMAMSWIARRLWRGDAAVQPLRLANRWTMLTE
jgi:hypothetical protein